MNKIIKKFKVNEYTYRLGYNVWENKVYPRIEILRGTNRKIIGNGYYSIHPSKFIYYTFEEDNAVDTIKEMFNRLRQYIEIPEKVEKEYENMFFLYKLNDFNIYEEYGEYGEYGD